MKPQSLLVAVFLITPTLAFGVTDGFTRSLSVGMRGEDVHMLQILLNADMETRIATAGAGSPGNETDYFGPATKRALVKFQEKYRAEVLAPAGLTTGTGFFGEKTRIKAAALSIRGAAVQGGEALSVSKGDVYVMFPSQYSGKPGTTITLSGAGFTTKDNIIYLGPNYAVEKASSWNGQSISFKIPQIPKGNYPLWVKNARGESNKDAFFVVTDGVTPEPVIKSVSPIQGARGTTITLTGSEFTNKGNTIRAGVTILENISSADGSTLSFSLPANTLSATTTSSSMKAVSVPIWFFVVNENGVSKGKSFTLSL